MFTFILLVVLEIAVILAMSAVVIGALYGLIRLYDAIVESGWYKKIMILIRQKNGKVKPVVVTIDKSGRIEFKETGRDIDGPECPKEIRDMLEKAERENSTINGDPAVRWDPDKNVEDEIRRRCGN